MPASDDFVALLTKHQRRLHAYIFSLVWNPADADDMGQLVAADPRGGGISRGRRDGGSCDGGRLTEEAMSTVQDKELKN